MWPHDGLVCLQVGRASTEALNVDSPLLRVQPESLKSAVLAESLDSVNVFVATVVAGTGVTLRVLVGHGRAEGVEDRTGSDILGGDEKNGLALTLNLLLLLQLLE